MGFNEKSASSLDEVTILPLCYSILLRVAFLSSNSSMVKFSYHWISAERNKANVVNKIPPVSIHRPITRKLPTQIANKQQKSAVEHTEAMMEEIDRMDEKTEMKDAEDWSIMDTDSSSKKNELTVVEYIDDIYAYYKKAEVHYEFKLTVETLYLTMNLINRFLAVQSVIRKKLQLVGITTLLLAFKYEEVFVPVVEDRILISDKAYARKKCLKWEWNTTCEKHSSYDKNQILKCSKLMVSFHQKTAVGKLTGMHQKYSTFKYDNAARYEPASFLLEAWF
ncbi:hypothetical protein BC332_26001 [Capsicum chinense]|nr:hypothetical protein BC332_26001 [Capsicum chinense]